MAIRYTVSIPWSDLPTKWHPTVKTGPFSILTRGVFRSQEEAEQWAAKHLQTHHHYNIMQFDNGS